MSTGIMQSLEIHNGFVTILKREIAAIAMI